MPYNFRSSSKNRTVHISSLGWRVQAFKDGDIRFLICTDVAARGIDIAGLPYLVNMTLPDRAEDYIHRVGRVGAALTILSLVIASICNHLGQKQHSIYKAGLLGMKTCLRADTLQKKSSDFSCQPNDVELLQCGNYAQVFS